MRGLTIIVAVGIIAGALGETQECLKATTEFEACKEQAYKNYQVEFSKGKDNKPDWIARKSCNYLMESVEKCGPIMGPCYTTEEELKQEKDKQIAGALKQVKELVKGWDSSKCPVAKEHEERLQAEADAAAAAADAEAAATKSSGGSTAMTASVLSTLIWAIFV